MAGRGKLPVEDGQEGLDEGRRALDGRTGMAEGDGEAAVGKS